MLLHLVVVPNQVAKMAGWSVFIEVLLPEYHQTDLNKSYEEKHDSKPNHYLCKSYKCIGLFRNFVALGFRFLREKR